MLQECLCGKTPLFNLTLSIPGCTKRPLEDMCHAGTAGTAALPAGDMRAADLPQLLFAKLLGAHHEPKACSSFFYLLLTPLHVPALPSQFCTSSVCQE